MKKSATCIPILLLAAVLFCGPAAGEEGQSHNSYAWKKSYLNVGYYLATMDSSFRLGETRLGVGLEIDAENLLGLTTTDTSLRIDGGYRFGRSLRHKLEFGWFRFNREGTRNFNTVINIPELPDGSGGGTIGPGQLNGVFNFDIIELTYAYSIVFDERFDFDLGAGFYIMPVEFGFTGTINGVLDSTVRENITAPLPVVGLGFDFAVTPKWFLRQDADVFYLEIDNYTGGIINLQVVVEYLPWKNAGFGFGVNSKQVFLEVDGGGTDVPGVDFIGDVEFSYLGALFYLKLFH